MAAAEVAPTLVDALVPAVEATLRQVASVFGPLAVLAVALHFVERSLSHRLVSRFGWRGVLVTGWLGVPVHELSHVVACLLFGHRVERVQLFAPDERTGRLGVVQHAWNRRNLYQQVGRFFIGMAPLVGGAVALLVVTRLVGPVTLALPVPPPDADLPRLLAVTVDRTVDLLAALARPEVLARGRTWLYLYLCLCIGAHLAPSGADLRGGLPGLLLLLVLLLGANVVALWLGSGLAHRPAAVLAVAAPVVSLLSLAAVLGAGCVALVWAVTSLLPARRA